MGNGYGPVDLPGGRCGVRPTVEVVLLTSRAPDQGWIRRLARACWRHRGVTVGALLASVFGVSLEAVGPLLTRVAVDDAVAGLAVLEAAARSAAERAVVALA
jgi:ATP-binding cassette subfamily B protein